MTASGASLDSPSTTVTRLLRGLDVTSVVDLRLHRQLHGPAPSLRAPELIDACRRVRMVGRGGAAFPVASKLDALRPGARVVVVNATESEPASYKDQVLVTQAPHLVLDGAALAAGAIAARTVHIAVHDESQLASLRYAIEQRPDRTLFRVTVIGGGFVAGEARSVVRALNGGPALPPGRRTLPSDRGVGGAATFLSNAETFAQLAVLASLGPRRYAAVGSSDEPGTSLISIDGAVERPGVVEVANGAELNVVLSSARARPAAALVVGGYHGMWLKPDPGLRLSRRGLAAVGGTLGAGVVLVVDDRTCALGELARVARWLAGESAQQCGPCRFGLPALAQDVEALMSGSPLASTSLHRHADLVTRRGACAHPDGAARLLSSGVSVLAHEIAVHQRHGSCGRPVLGQLPVTTRWPQ